MNLSTLPLSIANKLKNLGIGIAKGVGTLAETPGYLADLVTRGQKFAAPPSTLQGSQQWQQMTTPINKTQAIGHAIGSISPGTELITPGLKKVGVPSGLAVGVGLGINILTPGVGTGEARAAKLLNRLDDLIIKGDKTGNLMDLRAILTNRNVAKQDLDFVEGVLNKKINLNKTGEDVGFKTQSIAKSPTTNQPILSEARKYKSAEEFVKKQPVVYHGSESGEINKFKPAVREGSLGTGIYFADTPERARLFAGKGKITQARLNLKNPLYLDEAGGEDIFTKLGIEPGDDITKTAKKLGYDGIMAHTEDAGREIVVFNPKDVLTKSQLTDIWNQANREFNAVLGHTRRGNVTVKPYSRKMPTKK